MFKNIIRSQLNHIRKELYPMYEIDFRKPANIHFLGIGGISMSALAEILLKRGFKISGSDDKKSTLTKKLAMEGCSIHIGLTADNITDDIDAVVYTAAIRPGNSEYDECVRRQLPMLTRAELLGQIMNNYDTAIGVSGTHGKTSTTSMLTEILLYADTDPTISVGGMLSSIGGNLRIGNSQIFLTEACEYTNSFLSFKPTMNIILNVEEDHLDFFKDINDIRLSFKKYTELLPSDGTLIINSAIDDYEYFYKDSDCKVVTFGMDNKSDFSAKDIKVDEHGHFSYTLLYKNEAVCDINLKVSGEHNVCNSLAAIAAAVSLGIEPATAAQGISNYTGVDRRFQIKGKCNGFTIVDDYAHHPTEIEATLKAAKAFPGKKVWCIFQPHTYTRTKAFLPEFAKALSLADHVILAKIYEAREKDIYGVSSDDLKKLIDAKGTPCEYFKEFTQIEQFVLNNCQEGDLVITMGAGDVYEVGNHLLSVTV